MTDRRPDARPPRVRAAEFAASRWTLASGARLHVHRDDDHARVGDPLYRQAALASITAVDRLSRDIFDEWAARFAWHTADIFAAPSHRRLARERIEAQMLEPWFALPKHERPRTLALPPAPTPDELAAQLRALRQHDTDPTPPPANVEWARAVADRLSAEIAALADHPPP